MITIQYTGDVEEVKDAAIEVNKLLQSPQFYEDIKAHPLFDMATTTPTIIADLIFNSTIVMTVELYYSENKRVFGYDDDTSPTVIHINKNRNEFNVLALTNTMVHETVHAVDNITPQYYFGHGDNSSAGKANTAPYWIGNHAEQLLSGQDGYSDMLHEDAPGTGK